VVLAHEFKCLYRDLSICERVSWSGDPDDTQPRLLRPNGIEVRKRLIRIQESTRNARTTLIEAVRLSIAEIALDIATRRDR
jgi:hypothetical protein